MDENSEEQINLIKKLAEENGVKDNYFFETTFERYKTQLKILTNLKAVIDDEGSLVEKEYVKGRKNVYTHPAISEYNKTTDSANKTVTTLVKIISTLGNGKTGKGTKDPLMEILRGGKNDTRA